MGSHLLLLNWDNHKNNVIDEFQQLFSRSELTDVTLACEGFSLKAHKAVLSASSSFFRNMFLHHPCKHAFVILTDVNCEELKAIVHFMYKGKVQIPQEKFTQFLSIAEKLKIKGLSTVAENETCEALEDTVMDNEQLTHTDGFSERQQDSPAPLHKEKQNQRTETNINSRPLFNSPKRQRTSRESAATLNSSSGSSALKYSNISSETMADNLPDITVVASRNQPTELNLNIEDAASNSSASYKTIKSESRDDTVSMCREEPLIHIDSSSEKQSDTLYSSDPFQTNETQQLEFRLNPNEVSLHPVKDEQYGSEDNSICELEPDISSSSSAYNIPTSSGYQHNQPFITPMQSMLNETPQQHLFEAYPTDRTLSSTSSTVEVNPTCSSTEENKLNLMRNSLNSSKKVSNQITKSHTSNEPREKFYNNSTDFFSHFSQCKICKKKFHSESSLIAHQKCHIEEGNQSCGVCSKTFRWKENLKKHMKTHSGEQPYSCGFCNRKFSRKDNMVIHRRMHTGEQPYSCTFCEKRFPYSNKLTYHMRRHHQEKLKSCYICKKLFISDNSLKYHLWEHSRNEDVPLQLTIS